MKKSPTTLKAACVHDTAVFTLKSHTDSLKNTLCCQCAKSEAFEAFSGCSVKELTALQSKLIGIATEITHCRHHEPVIAFAPPLIGFDSIFNTIRPGVAWHSRLKDNPDAVIGLLDAKTSELFGKAQMVSVDSGNIMKMLDEYAEANHLMLNCKSDQPGKLFAVLSKIYGPQIINPESTVSVISLRRV